MDPTDRPILVVDDDAKIVRLVRTYLERERYQVVEASDGPSALAAIETAHPRLVVLDLMLPGIDGLAVIRAIRDERDTPVIVLSARGTANDRIVGLGLGADDYVPKPFSPAELVLRVNRVLARSERSHGRPTSKPLELGGLIVDRVRVEVRVDGRPVELTAVEFRLLTSLIEADGRVLSREQLIDAVYGADTAEIVDRTVDVHVGRLRDKLGDRADAPRFIATVRGLGYRAVVDRGATQQAGAVLEGGLG
jgi:DNA-binding response OmpR family regulator